MCSVDPEGKWQWYLKLEYGVLTVAHYLKLGASLGGVQTRHSMTNTRLRWRKMNRRIRRWRNAAALRAKTAGGGSGGEAVGSCNCHEQSIQQFECALRRGLEREAQQQQQQQQQLPTTNEEHGLSGSNTSSVSSAVLSQRHESPARSSAPFHPFAAAAGDAMEDLAADILAEEAEAVNGTWDSGEVLARWEKKQLLRYYLDRRDSGRRDCAQRALQQQQQQQADTADGTVALVPPPASRPLLSSHSPFNSSIHPIPSVEIERELLTQVLNEFGDCVDITHGEAVDMRLLKLFTNQAVALRNRRLRKATAGAEAARATVNAANDDGDENAFVLADTDATYKLCKQEGRPTAVTYADAVRLTTLLGEAIAWESFKLYADHQARLKSVATESGSTTAANYGETVKSVRGVTTAVQPDCIAVMLPNSVEYNLVWWGISRSGPLKTFLTELYDGAAFTEGTAARDGQQGVEEAAPSQRNLFARAATRARQALFPRRNSSPVTSAPVTSSATSRAEPAVAVYRPCRTALINTNLSSNAMLFHALSCSGCMAIVLDVQFAPLLFVANSESPDGALTLNVPPQLKRIFLWRWNGTFSSRFTQQMKSQLDHFNVTAYEHLPDALSTPVARSAEFKERSAGKNNAVPPLVTPALDLFALVRTVYEELKVEEALETAQDAPAATTSADGRCRRTQRVSGSGKDAFQGVPSRFPLLLERILSHPPRWLCCDPAQWSPRKSPVSSGTLHDDGAGNAPERHAAAVDARPNRATVAHNLFANLYVCSIRDSIAKNRELAVWEPHADRQQQQRLDAAAEERAAAHARFQSRVTELDKKLRAQQETFSSRTSAALSRFTPVQPVLFIYTSGTTGLPKAARFSHLRFFATSFLSQTLRYRRKTQEVLEANQAARKRFQAALKQGVAAAQEEAEQGKAQTGDSEPLLSAFADEETRVKRTAFTAFTAMCGCYVVNWVTFTLWLLGLLFYARRLHYMLRRFLHRITFQKQSWLDAYAREAEVAEELSCLSVYNCLPMHHTIGCVFCLGQLMRALEEQQAAQHDIERQLAWHRAYDLAVRSGDEDWGTAPYVPTRPLTARMVIRSKFSASRCLHDLQKYHITVVQYIGEVLRYALLYERDHAPSAALVEQLLREQLALILDDATGGAASLPEKPALKAADVLLAVDGDSNSNLPLLANSGIPSTTQILRRLLPTLTDGRDTLHLMNLLGRWAVPYAFGNGLRKDIWLEVKERLSIAQLVEFYSSTEGNIFLFNLFDIPGAVGHIPRFPGPLNWILDMSYFPIFPFRVLKYEEDTQQIWRDPKSNYAKVAAVGEPGEAVGEIIEGYDMFALRRFDGYHQEQPAGPASALAAKNSTSNGVVDGSASAVVNIGDVESKKKVIRHIMWPYKHDAYFRSGDLVKIDDCGFVSFVDRVGETFRWKGENVSTLEVENAMSTVHTETVGVQEAVVYGVSLPGYEGRAGMALLTLRRRSLQSAEVKGGEAPICRRPTLQEERLFLQNDLYQFLCGRRCRNGDGTIAQSALPSYATPLFLRVEDAAEEEEGEEHGGGAGDQDTAVRTATFKYRKTVLMRQGYAQVPPSTVHNTQAWGDEGQDATAAGVVNESRPASRFYVLVTKPDLWAQLSRAPREVVEARAGYVPLTAKTVELVGDRFTGCGW